MPIREDSAGLAEVAGLLADETRATMCITLLDGRAWTAGELARQAGVVASTASEHIDRLIDGGLVAQERQGRHRYIRLAGPDAADLIEALTAYAAPRPSGVRTLRAARASAVMAAGRTCYDHLAGRLGVAVTDAMTRYGYLDQSGGFAITPAGLDWLSSALGSDSESLRASRRPLVRSCVDWTERRPHLAGRAGAEVCHRLLERGWIERVPGIRAVRVTPTGGAGLRDLLGLQPADLAVVS
jgi:DNA-binding transcriptional ArsR family regulator